MKKNILRLKVYLKTLQDEMTELRQQPLEDGIDQRSENQILVSVLGKKSGYLRGMGHGIKVGSSSSSHISSSHDNELRDRLATTESQLERANEKIAEANEKIVEANEKIASYEEKMKTYEDQMKELQQFMRDKA